MKPPTESEPITKIQFLRIHLDEYRERLESRFSEFSHIDLGKPNENFGKWVWKYGLKIQLEEIDHFIRMINIIDANMPPEYPNPTS